MSELFHHTQCITFTISYHQMFVLSVGDFERSISLQAGFGKQLDIDKKSTDSCLNYLKFFRLTQDALL